MNHHHHLFRPHLPKSKGCLLFFLVATLSIACFNISLLSSFSLQWQEDNFSLLPYDDINSTEKGESNRNTKKPEKQPKTHLEMPALEAFTECMLQIEEHFQANLPRFANATQPFPFSVKIVKQNVYVLLSLSITGYKGNNWTDPSTRYACNGVDGGIALPAYKSVALTLIVKCPQTLSPRHDFKIKTFSITKLGNEMDKVDYNVEKFAECEEKDTALFAPDRNESHPITTGVTATFSGGREEALEWAAYHHLIGFDHVWMYVNEPWDAGKDIPSTNFVTFIPYNTKINYFRKRATIQLKNIAPMEAFRISSQNDALWRAKRMGLEWMAFVDMDEMIVLGTSAQRNVPMSNLTAIRSSSSPLQTYLADFKAKRISKRQDGILLRSVPVGKNNSNETKPELMIDYTWRQNLNLTMDCCRSRRKMIVDVNKVDMVNIHFIGKGGKNGKLFIPKTSDELHVNHYKGKDNGVFNMKYHWLGPPHIIEDTRLRDQYRDRVVEIVASIRQGHQDNVG